MAQEFPIEQGFFIKRLSDGRVQLRVTTETYDHSPTLRRAFLTQERWEDLVQFMDQEDGQDRAA